MAAVPILLLGDSRLRRVCRPVTDFTDPELRSAFADLTDTLVDFQRRQGFGRAIAASVDIESSEKSRAMRLLARQPFLGPNQLPLTYSVFRVEEEKESFESRREGAQIEAELGRMLGTERVLWRGGERYRLGYPRKLGDTPQKTVPA